MENDQARFFDARAAASYDEVSARPDTVDTVDFLEGWARGGPVLELAIGTGRIALPLAARGLGVDGIDISPAMVAVLRSRPGGDRIGVTIGDMADVDVARRYRLVYVVFNSFCNLVDQDEQVRCLENVAAHLTDDGVFVVESLVPDPEWLRAGQYVHAESVGSDEVRLDVCRVDAVAQLLEENHVVLTDDGIRLQPILTRYVWPSEVDLMARLAGLERVERWADWGRRPFTSASRSFVVVYSRGAVAAM